MKTKGLVRWSSLHKLDEKFEPQWYIEIEVSKEDANALKEIGLKVKTVVDEDENIIYTFKANRRQARYKGGTVVGKNNKPVVVDAALNPFDGIMGRGTEVWVVHKPWQWSNKKGWSADLQKVQILNLVPFQPSGSKDDDDVLEVEGEGLQESYDPGDDLVVEDTNKEEDKVETKKGMGDDVPF